MGELKHFLLIFEPGSGELDVREFENADEANAEFADAEVKYRSVEGVQVVMLSAASEKILRTTHGHYFNQSQPDTDGEYAAV